MDESTPLLWASSPESVARRISGFLDPATGGCSYTLSSSLQDSDWIHCEVSGYALAFFTRLLRLGRPGWRTAADGLARFLLRAQLPQGGFPHSTHRGRSLPDRMNEVHSFDTGICAAALLDYAQTVGCAKAKRAAERALDWLVDCGQGTDGRFRCVYDQDMGAWDGAQRMAFWSSEDGCYMGKLLIPLCSGGRLEAADQLAKLLLQSQRGDGAWNATPRHDTAHSHAMLYTLEGLLAYARRRDSEKAFEAVRRGMDWLAVRAIECEGLPEWCDGEPRAYRSDAQLQFLRLSAMAPLAGLPGEALRACATRLKALQTPDGFWRSDTADLPQSCRLTSWSLVFEGVAGLVALPWEERLV
jgi:hypothetical protein